MLTHTWRCIHISYLADSWVRFASAPSYYYIVWNIILEPSECVYVMTRVRVLNNCTPATVNSYCTDSARTCRCSNTGIRPTERETPRFWNRLKNKLNSIDDNYYSRKSPVPVPGISLFERNFWEYRLFVCFCSRCARSIRNLFVVHSGEGKRKNRTLVQHACVSSEICSCKKDPSGNNNSRRSDRNSRGPKYSSVLKTSKRVLFREPR